MTPATVVKAADAAQFLSFVPLMLGYHPSESLVVIPFQGARSLGAMRFDLPAGGETDGVAATVIGLACRLPEADAVAAIAYTGARFEDRDRMPHRELLDALDRRAHACGLRVTDLLCVAADGWGSALDSHLPASGRPLSDLEGAGTQLQGMRAADGDQASGADLPECPPGEQERVARALTALDDAVEVLCGPDAVAGGRLRGAPGVSTAPLPEAAHAPEAAPAPDDRAPAAGHACDLGPVPGPIVGDADEGDPAPDSNTRIDPRALGTACRLDDLPGLFEDALEQRPAGRDAYDSAALVWCLARPSLRDVALVQWSGNLADGDEALDAQLRWESGEEYPAHLAMRMWGEGDTPDVARLEVALEVCRHAAAVAPREARPGALAMCAWLSWALGRSTHAAAYAGMACEIEPEHGLSQIVLSFVQAGHLPDWAFRRGAPR